MICYTIATVTIFRFFFFHFCCCCFPVKWNKMENGKRRHHGCCRHKRNNRNNTSQPRQCNEWSQEREKSSKGMCRKGKKYLKSDIRTDEELNCFRLFYFRRRRIDVCGRCQATAQLTDTCKPFGLHESNVGDTAMHSITGESWRKAHFVAVSSEAIGDVRFELIVCRCVRHFPGNVGFTGSKRPVIQ